MITREQICSQQIHCLSCPLIVWRKGKDCRNLTLQRLEKMAEYLEREYILNAIRKASNLYIDQQGLYLSCELIAAMPATDVQSVKHGCWEEVTDYGGWGDTHYRCSVCGEEWYLEDGTPKQNNMNFCPRCGARMDGEQNENNK